MNRLFILFFAALFASSSAYSQEGHFKCGTDEYMKEARRAYPSIVERERELQEFTENFTASAGSRTDQVYIIPVVFHIIHQWGEENISNAQIFDQMAILNRDFRKLNADTSLVIEEFQDIIADCRIEFRLATIDPMGNCTNGIDRIASVQTYLGKDGAKLNSWPRSKYLNVWVVRDMDASVAGYSYYPSAVTDSPMAFADGIVVRYNFIGSIGTSEPSHSRTLTHEVGHYLNLSHTWGDSNDPGVACGDDYVTDTPETKGWSTCTLNGAICNPGVIENVQNYMEYSSCSRMFTDGQQQRMEAALNSPISYRNNLWSEENLAATGTDGIHNLSCAPKSDFYPEKPIICQNNIVRFIDNSTLAVPTGWTWTFQDGNPATSNQQNPQVSFNTDGWKKVTLTVSNSLGETTYSNTRSIYVTPEWAELQGGLLNEEFESASDFDFYWKVRNLDSNETSWKRTTSAGFSDGESVYINAGDAQPSIISLPGGDIDELITPSMDLNAMNSGTFSFRYAYATAATTPDMILERLEISTSVNCGETWVLRKTITGLNIVTAGNVSSPFFPENDSQWQYYSFPIPSSITTDQVRFKFVFNSTQYSNNLFIDDVNISGSVGVDEIESSASLRLFPNPANGNTVYLIFPENLGDPQILKIYDISGKLVQTQPVLNEMVADHSIIVDSSGLSEGVYTIELKGSKQRLAGRLIVSHQ
ncbi:MAG: choice-of-anchor J domain-containing protein [Crocinitomicaceae bacterium]|nr:choice-of-anchor J domain-containing protein [Crocinitomicaceae bacterium]